MLEAPNHDVFHTVCVAKIKIEHSQFGEDLLQQRSQHTFCRQRAEAMVRTGPKTEMLDFPPVDIKSLRLRN